jgi:Ca2+/H+ antiporter
VEEALMLEQQYDYYRNTSNKIIFYALGIVVAFAITLVVQHADGKYILEESWFNSSNGPTKVIGYALVFIISWIVYFIALRKMDAEMKILREYFAKTDKLTTEESALLERNTKWELRLGVFLLACCLLLVVFIDTKPKATTAAASSTLICRTP